MNARINHYCFKTAEENPPETNILLQNSHHVVSLA